MRAKIISQKQFQTRFIIRASFLVKTSICSNDSMVKRYEFWLCHWKKKSTSGSFRSASATNFNALLSSAPNELQKTIHPSKNIQHNKPFQQSAFPLVFLEAHFGTHEGLSLPFPTAYKTNSLSARNFLAPYCRARGSFSIATRTNSRSLRSCMEAKRHGST